MRITLLLILIALFNNACDFGEDDTKYVPMKLTFQNDNYTRYVWLGVYKPGDVPPNASLSIITQSDQIDWYMHEYSMRVNQTEEFELSVPEDGYEIIAIAEAPGDVRRRRFGPFIPAWVDEHFFYVRNGTIIDRAEQSCPPYNFPCIATN